MLKSVVLGAWIAACSADIATTRTALALGGQERYLTGHASANTLILGSEATAGTMGYVWLSRRGRKAKVLATMLLVGLTAIEARAALHNLHTIAVMRAR